MKKAKDSVPGLVCVGWGQLVKKLEPKTLRRGPWNEQKFGAEVWVSKGHRMGKLGCGQFSSYLQRSGEPLAGMWVTLASNS